MNAIKSALAISLTALLCACGGGGGSDSTTPTTPATPPTGKVSLHLLAGSIGGVGYADGVGEFAAFYYPQGVVKDHAGNLYVSDSYNLVIRKITPQGVVSTFAGNGPGALTHPLLQPLALAIDNSDTLYVVDGTAIRKVTPQGVISTLVDQISPFPGEVGGLTVDPHGTLYAASTGNKIYQISTTGIVTTIHLDISGSVGLSSMVMGRDGYLYATDALSNTILKISVTGKVQTFAGSRLGDGGFLDGVGLAALFVFPLGLTQDASGNLYVADSGNCAIRKVSPAAVVTTIARNHCSQLSDDGTAKAAQLNGLAGIAVDDSGNVFVAAVRNHTIVKVTAAGVVTPFAGRAPIAGYKDAPGANAAFNFPQQLSVDAVGNVYTADYLNNVIRITTPTGAVSTLAGNLTAGHADGQGALASFDGPRKIVTDAYGTTYVADDHAIRKITAQGTVTTLAGKADVSGFADGTGAAALFYYPEGLTLDQNGNLYVTDSGNASIRKITPSGVVTTVAGKHAAPSAPFAFTQLSGLVMDHQGSLIVTEAGGPELHKISPNGQVTLFATIPTETLIANPDATRQSAFHAVEGITIDHDDNIYVVDSGQNAVYKISPDGEISKLLGINGLTVEHPKLNGGIAILPNGNLILSSNNGLVYTRGL
jgi:sugar lactone lactonase YvrE